MKILLSCIGGAILGGGVAAFASTSVYADLAPGLEPDSAYAATDPDFVPLNNIFHPAHGEKATFRYVLAQPGPVTLRIYTRTGTLVATLVDEVRPAGTSSVDWTGVNQAGETVASGVYLVRIVGPGLARTQKAVVVK
ncbi:MAG TPA: FlgD immunoglobulin-like domain containing protein [Elusimicrobiota bacterium]|nr:FlgD immunoglobulin-like domain containing protein [Elusimicrobiota bacterium]